MSRGSDYQLIAWGVVIGVGAITLLTASPEILRAAGAFLAHLANPTADSGARGITTVVKAFVALMVPTTAAGVGLVAASELAQTFLN